MSYPSFAEKIGEITDFNLGSRNQEKNMLITYISLSVSESLPLRELVAREDSEVGKQKRELELFSACSGEDLRTMNVGETFELCQAGYPDRKLAYNSRTRLVFSHRDKKYFWNHYHIS